MRGVEALDDEALTCLLREVSGLRAEADTLVSMIAGVVAKRSQRDLGYAGLAQREGHRTPAAMVQAITGVTRAEAARQVRIGEALGETDAATRLIAGAAPAGDTGLDGTSADDGKGDGDKAGAPLVEVPWYQLVTEAITAGTITAEAGAGILRGLGQPDDHVTPEQLRAAAIQVLAEASGVNVDDLIKHARWARDGIDPVGVEGRSIQRYEARSWRFGHDKSTGAITAWVVFDDESAAWIRSIIDAALSPRRGGPRFVSAEEQARADALVADPRTNDQLVFDTVIDVLHAGALADAGAVFGARQPGVRLIITAEQAATRGGEGTITGTGYYENTGESVPGAVIDRHLCNSGYLPVTVNSCGQPLDVGREQRLFTAKQRVALRIRDGGCMWPGCDRPPDYGEAHHIEAWVADHGRTDVADGILLCRHHHMLLHNNRWKIRRRGTIYNLIPPATVDPSHTPIRLHSKSPLRYPVRAG